MNHSPRSNSHPRAVLAAAVTVMLGAGGIAVAAQPADGTAFWLGCYRLTFGDDASKTRVLRLTDTPVPARPGNYAVESVPASEADLSSQWRPVGATSIRIGVSNGRSGWSAELKAADGNFVGQSNWVDDDGKSGAGYVVTATSVACDEVR